MKPALVLSTGTSALGVIGSLGRRGVPVIALYHDPAEVGYVSRWVHEAIRAPHPEHEEAELRALLLALAPRFGGGVLMPCSDPFLAAVASHKGELARHYHVACPDAEIAQTVLEKSRTYAVARAAGVPTPRTLVLSSREQVEREGRAATFPCLVKPVTGHQYYRIFQKKMVLAESFEELVAAWHEAEQAGTAVMLQEFVPGGDGNGVNYNGYFWQGEPLLEFTAAKVRGAPAKIGSPRVVVSRHVSEVIEPGRRLMRALGYSGFACTEFKRDARDGTYTLMEVNGRHNMSSRLAVRCGMDFPWLEYRHHVFGEAPAPGDFVDGIWWIDLARDVAHGVAGWREERYGLVRTLEPYLRPHVFATLDWRDPRPFLNRLKASLAWLFQLGCRGPALQKA